MTSDNFDKTVFKKPSVSSDRTVLRPAPGGRRSGQSPAAPPIQAHASSAQQPRDPRLHAQGNDQAVADSSDYFNTLSGLNPIVNAASTLIAVFEQIRQSLTHPDIAGLHHRLVREIKKFEQDLQQLSVQPEIIISARYCVCAALDEAVLNTPWGSESAWPQRSLLSVFHNETFGGEKFFLILERMLQQPAKNLYLLELMYIFLSLGFEGKYRVVNHGSELLQQVRDELFMAIRRQTGDYERSLSPSWKGLGSTRKSLTNYLPVWVVASILGAVLLLSYSGFRYWLFESSTPVVEKLDEIADMRTIARNATE